MKTIYGYHYYVTANSRENKDVLEFDGVIESDTVIVFKESYHQVREYILADINKETVERGLVEFTMNDIVVKSFNYLGMVNEIIEVLK